MFKRMVRWASVAPLLAVLVTGCGSDGGSQDGERKLTVFAAASLTETFTELGQVFEKENSGVKVVFNFGSSATLAQQITQGAPADVFAAASPATMMTATDAKPADSPVVFARNKLRIAVPAGNPAKIDALGDLADAKVKVALCAEQVPCGAAAVKALEAAGVKVTPVTLEQDVKATLTKVRLGEVDAALVYATDVLSAGGEVEGIAFPEADEAVNDYLIAPLGEAVLPAEARKFVDLVLSDQGRETFTRTGFLAP